MDFPDEGSDLSANSGNAPSSERAETYGPIGFRRYVKGDGRALVLYARGSPTDGVSTDEGPASE